MSTLQLIRGGRDLDAGIQIAQLRKVVADLFAPNRALYWFDMLASATIGYGLLGLAIYWSEFLWISIAFLFLSSLALYRGLLFVHEIAHFRKDSVPGFAFAWNVIYGVPFFVPSFMYQGVHLDHHSKLVYGTAEDGEYVPFAVEGRKRILLYFMTVIISPFLLYIRYAFLAPLSLFIPSFRKIVISQLSSLVIDFEYVRGDLKPAEQKTVAWQEPLVSCYGILLTSLVFAGVIPLYVVFYIYALTAIMFAFNTVRTVAAHRYANAGERIDMVKQLTDSVNITSRHPLELLLCPVGLRFHALHHLFPTMPYHSLEKAHERIMRTVPSDSLYHSVNEPTLFSAVKSLWRASKQNEEKGKLQEKTSLVPQFTQSHRVTNNLQPSKASNPTTILKQNKPELDPGI